MNRTQIYLNPHQTEALLHLSHTLQQGKSELIRTAIDEFVARRTVQNKLKKIRAARGMWKHRKDILDIQKLRAAWDRF